MDSFVAGVLGPNACGFVLQFPSTIRLGQEASNNTIRLVRTPNAMVLMHGKQEVLLVNSTDTILFGPNGLSSFSLTSSGSGSFVHVVADAVISPDSARPLTSAVPSSFLKSIPDQRKVPTTIDSAVVINAALTANAALTVNAAMAVNNTATIRGMLSSLGDTVIGSGGSDTLTVNSVTTFTASSTPITANALLVATAGLGVTGAFATSGK